MKKCALIIIVEPPHTAALHTAVPYNNNNNNIIASTSRAAFCVPNNRLYFMRVYYNNNNVIYVYLLNEFLNLKSERFIRLVQSRPIRYRRRRRRVEFYIHNNGRYDSSYIYSCSGDN